jgi:alkanesulfonate monooxygenase SsuD/methylene tetrahydromethanopterin reductase-like flavin-dependent oxidoreductase (luciferase family)
MASFASRPIRFGALLRQADNRWTSIAESARIADDLGFHAIHFIDHLLAIPDPAGDILESWTTMTACATLTRRVRVSANVLCNSFRSPALLAKMTAVTTTPGKNISRLFPGRTPP